MSDSASYFENSLYVKELTPKDFDNVSTWKLKNLACSVVLFYAPWCPHCKAIKDVWSQLGKTASFINVFAFNCEKYSGHLMKIKEDMPNLVKGFPTIIYYTDGTPTENFEGERTHNNLLKKSMSVCQQSHK